MLPVTVQFIVAMPAYALKEPTARRLDYLLEENRVLNAALRSATGKSRIPLTNEQRRRLATKGKALTPAEREDCCQRVRPSTLLAWFRQRVARKYDSSRARRPARPRKANEIRDLVLCIATENPGWGYTTGWTAHHAASVGEQRQRNEWRHPLSFAAWRTAQFLRPGGGVTACTELPDTTGLGVERAQVGDSSKGIPAFFIRTKSPSVVRSAVLWLSA